MLKKLNCICYFSPIGCVAMLCEDMAGQFFNSRDLIHKLREIYKVKFKKKNKLK
jgi:hypothetical protein